MNRSIEAEHIHLRPEDILVIPTAFRLNDLIIFLSGFILNLFVIYPSFGFYRKLIFITLIFSEVLEVLWSYKNSIQLHPNRSDISKLKQDIIDKALVMFLMYFLMVTFRMMYYFHDQITDLITRFIIAFFDLNNIDDSFFDTHNINGSDSDDSGDDDDNDDDDVPHNNNRHPRDEEYEGDNEDNEGNDEFELMEYVLRFVYNERMSSGFYGEFLANNEYPDYGNYPANSDDEILSDADTDDDSTDGRAYFLLEPVNYSDGHNFGLR